VRLMQFVGELNSIVSSISNSMKSLFWTLVLMMLMIYVVGIFFTQIVTNYGDKTDTSLRYWWGSLSRSILTLYQSIMGGVDWDDLVNPLGKIHWMMCIFFAGFIAFAMLAMMNVITGIFVNSALEHAQHEKEMDFERSSQEIFEGEAQEGEDVEITYDMFEKHINTPGPFQNYVKSVGIDLKDAKTMFKLMDKDDSGTLEVDELLGGMLRLRTNAKFLDIALMMNGNMKQSEENDTRMNRIEKALLRLCKHSDDSQRNGGFMMDQTPTGRAMGQEVSMLSAFNRDTLQDLPSPTFVKKSGWPSGPYENVHPPDGRTTMSNMAPGLSGQAWFPAMDLDVEEV